MANTGIKPTRAVGIMESYSIDVQELALKSGHNVSATVSYIVWRFFDRGGNAEDVNNEQARFRADIVKRRDAMRELEKSDA